MSKLMKLIGEGRAIFASVLCLPTKALAAVGLLSLVLLGATSARAEYVPAVVIKTDNMWETAYNPFAEPLTMPHWISNLVRHEMYTNYMGEAELAKDIGGIKPLWRHCAWFIGTNRYDTVNYPTADPDYYKSKHNWPNQKPAGFYEPTLPGDEKTCLAYIEKQLPGNLTWRGNNPDKVLTKALCRLLRPVESTHDDIQNWDSTCAFGLASNLFTQTGTIFKPRADSGWLAGQHMDGATFWVNLESNTYRTRDWINFRQGSAKLAPSNIFEYAYARYGKAVRDSLTYLNMIPDDWEGSYTLKAGTNRREAAYEDKWGQTVHRTITDGDAWPMFDEDVKVDIADVRMLRFFAHMADALMLLPKAYHFASGPVGTNDDDVGIEIKQLSQLQWNMWMIGYTDHLYGCVATNRGDRIGIRHEGYQERMERCFHDMFHVAPAILSKVDNKSALGEAKTAYQNGLANFIAAVDFIRTKRDDQIHLFEFLSADDEYVDCKGEVQKAGGGEWNIDGWYTIATNVYASLTSGQAQSLDLVRLGKELKIRAADEEIDFSGLGKDKDGKVALNAAPLFDTANPITPRSFVLGDGKDFATTNNTPTHWVKTRWSTHDGYWEGKEPYTPVYGNGVNPKTGKKEDHWGEVPSRAEIPTYNPSAVKCTAFASNLVGKLQLNINSKTVDATLKGVYPDGTLFDDLLTMTTRYPAERTDDKIGLTGFARTAKVANCERKTVTVNDSPYVLEEDKTYTAPKSTGKGGAFFVNSGATLVGTNVTFKGNKAAGTGGAIYNYGGTVSLDGVTFEGNTAKVNSGAIYNKGTVHFDGAVILKTESDTIFNGEGRTLNWNLADGKHGFLGGYQNISNSNAGATLQLTVGNYADATNEFVIATGDFSNVEGKDTFTVKNGAATTTLQIGGRAALGATLYELALEEDLAAVPPTTNLVFTAIKIDVSHVIVDSTLPGGYKPGDDIPDLPGFFYGINYVTEMPEAGLLAGTETLEIAGSAAITNAVTLKSPAKLILDEGAALSIMGDGAKLSGLGETASIEGQGAIYLDKDVDEPGLAYYTAKLATGSNITVARASVDDDMAKEAEHIKDNLYTVATKDQPSSGETNETVVTSNIATDGQTSGLALRVDDEKNLTVAGSVTAEGTDQTLKLVREADAAGDLVVNGKVSGFDSIVVENKNEEGKMTATSTLAANKNITILNDGHLNAKAQAGADLYIKNTTANTLIGEYSGQNVTVTNTAEGVAKDIVLQAYGTGTRAGMVILVGEDGSIYSNAVIVAGKNATPGDLSANDGSGTVGWTGTNTFSGTVVLPRSGGFDAVALVKFVNANAVVPRLGPSAEIAGECNISSNELGTANADGALTLKDGAVLGGNTRLNSTCNDDKFALEGTVTMKDGAEFSRSSESFTVPAGATLKLQGATITAGKSYKQLGTLLVESGKNEIRFTSEFDAETTMSLTLMKGSSLTIDQFYYNRGVANLAGGEFVGTMDNEGLVNWDLTEGTTTLNWAKVFNDTGSFRLTVGDAATGTSYVLATNVTAAVTDTFTVTNSVTGGAATMVKAGGICKAGNTFYALEVKDGVLSLTALQAVRLSDVMLIDSETGKTNATAVVKAGNSEFKVGEDGVYEVPAGYELTVVYTATDDKMFGPGWETKTVVIGVLTGDTSMDDPKYAGLKPTTEERWVDVREIALDVRERIVVESPNEVLPLAYSSNNWDKIELPHYSSENHFAVAALYVNGTLKMSEKNKNGYYDWMPETAAYGAYDIKQEWLFDGALMGATNVTIYYSARSPLTWNEPQDGTFTATVAGEAITNGTPVLGYSYVNLAATPESHYQFTGWTATTNGFAYADGFTNTATLVTRFEMPLSEAKLGASFAWQSVFKDQKIVNEGETWEVFEGDDYGKGITNNGTIVWKPGVTNKLGKASFFPNIDQLQNGADGKLQIVFDSTLTNGTYKLAGGAPHAKGLTFEITNGSDGKDCTVVDEDELETTVWVYVGAKRFKLYIDSDYDLQLLVEWGIPQAVVFAADPVAACEEISASTNGAALFSGERIYPGETVGIAAAAAKDWQFVEWTGEDALGEPIVFEDAMSFVTTFKMAETSVVVTANMKISDQLIADVLFVITNGAAVAIETVDGFAIPETTKAMTAYQINYAKDRLIEALYNASTPAEVYGVRDSVKSTYSYYVEKVRPVDTPSYEVKVASDPATAGTAKANTAKAKLGEVVTLTATVTAANYAFDRWTGTDATGAAIDFVTPYNLTTTFDMPATNVSVTATFKVSGDYRGKAVENVLKAQTGANAALAKIGNLTDAEYADYTNQVALITSEQIQAIADAKTPAEVAAAEQKAKKDIGAVVEEATEYATKLHEIALDVEPAEAGTASVTNKAVVHTVVTVKAAANENWAFAGWTGTYGEEGVIVFADATNLETTFEMPSAAVSLAAAFKVDPAYVEAQKAEVAKAAASARAEIVSLNLTDDEKASFTNRVNAIERDQLAAIAAAKTPEAVAEAADDAQEAFDATVEEAKELATRAYAIEAEVVPVESGTVTITNAAPYGATVAVSAEAADGSWAFAGWTGEDAAGEPLVFADATAAETTFAMPATNVFVTAAFKVSAEYVAAAVEAVTNGAEAAYAAVDALDELLPADREEAYLAIAAAEVEALLKLTDVATPAEADAAVQAAQGAYKAAVDAAARKSLSSVYFESKTVEGVEGEEIEVVVEGGSNVKPTQVTVSLQKNTLTSYTAYYGVDTRLKPKKASFPLVLNWDAGDREPKTITFVTTKTTKVEADRFLTLQLGSEAAIVVGTNDVCTLTVRDAVTPTVDTTPYVRALAYPANGGKVSGYGALGVNKKTGEITSTKTLTATANKWATFAGWYEAKTDDPNTIDLSKPVEPVSAKKPTQIKVGKGTEYLESATFFAYFTNVTPVASVDVPDASAAGAAGVVCEDGEYVGMVGVKFALPVSFQDETGKGSLTVSGLPSGLSYNKKTGRIEGVPTAVSEKTAKFVAKNAAGSHTATFDFAVEALDPMAIGNFAGVVSDDVDGAAHRTGCGSVTFTAGKTGALSAKVTTRLSGARSFSVKGYDRIDEYTLGIAMTNNTKEVFEATLSLTNGLYGTFVAGRVYGLDATKRGTLAYNDEGGTVVALRNAFLKADKNEEALAILADYKGTYEATLFDTATNKAGTVTYKVADNGAVTVKAVIDATYDGAKKVAAKTMSGTVAGGFAWDPTTEQAGFGSALRSGTTLWSCEVLFDNVKDAATGAARYIRPNAEDKEEVVDVDQLVD